MDHIVEALATSLGVTEKGISIIKNVIDSEPARRVRASSVAGNKSVRYPSRKMGLVIQAESELEFCGVLMKEYSGDVLKYYDQPPTIDLVYQSGSRTVRTPSTLDYFVVSQSFIGFEEWKPTSELMKIAEKRPDHIYFDVSHNRFISPALERYLTGTGLAYRICTEKDLNPAVVQNYNFLSGYFNEESSAPYEKLIKEIVSALKKRKAISISDAISSGFEVDSIYYAIASNRIFFPISDVDIINQETSYIFVDDAEWNKYKKVAALDEPREIESAHDLFHEKLLKCNPVEIEKAIFKLQQIKKVISGEIGNITCAENLSVTKRTINRMRAVVEKASSNQEKLLLLIPNSQNSGNANVKISSVILDKIDDVYNETYLSKKAISPHKLCLKVIAWCNENNLHPPSKTTIYNYVESNPDWIKVLKRQGLKAAYQKTAYWVSLSQQPSLRATYFLARCHIDHTQVDVELVDDFGESVGKAWLTIIIDEFTGFILSFYLSFRSPSYVTLMMAVRGMVRNHLCLPESVMVDGGKEFQGYDFEVFCGLYDITIYSREGQPRDGGSVERKFGSVNTQLVHNLDGNTKFMKNVREISRSHNPKNSAALTLYGLSKRISTYVDENNNSSVKIGALSPAALIGKSHKLFGSRKFLNQPYDEQFIFHTMPYISKKTARLNRGKPIIHDYHEYWHDSFAGAPANGMDVSVKWDPEDSNVACVYYEFWKWCRLVSKRNMSRATDRALAAEATRLEAKINRKAKQQSYIAISNSLDKVEEALNHEETQNKSKKISAKKSKSVVASEPSTFSLFDLVIPNSIEK